MRIKVRLVIDAEVWVPDNHLTPEQVVEWIRLQGEELAAERPQPSEFFGIGGTMKTTAVQVSLKEGV